MPYESVDALQGILTREVFDYAKDAKKAAGRALGTIVELITFYLLKGWGCETYTMIERRLPEFANPEITHNVEFSMHPATAVDQVCFTSDSLPITSTKILKQLGDERFSDKTLRKASQLLTSGGLLQPLRTSDKHETTRLWSACESFCRTRLPLWSASVLASKMA